MARCLIIGKLEASAGPLAARNSRFMRHVASDRRLLVAGATVSAGISGMNAMELPDFVARKA